MTPAGPLTTHPLTHPDFMNKLIPLTLLIGGIIIMVMGINATQSFNSDLSRFFTGAPTDKAVWTLILGSILTVIGLTMTLRSSKSV